MKVEKLPDGKIKIYPTEGSDFWFTLPPELALHLAAICDDENKARIQEVVLIDCGESDCGCTEG